MEEPETKTDGQGDFVLRHVTDEARQVMATARHFAPEVAELGLGTTSAPLKFTLLPGKTLRARVVDGDGKPIPKVAVRTWFWHSSQVLRWNGWTNNDGYFEMPDAPPDAVTFS